MRRLLLLALVATSCDKPPQPAPTPTETPQTIAPTTPSPYPDGERRVIDVHLHLTPGEGVALMLKYAPQLGIEQMVNLSGGNSEQWQRAAVADLEGRRDQVLLFHNIDWSKVNDPNFAQGEVARMRAAAARGYAGMKISKALGLGVQRNGQLLAIDDPLLDPIWREAAALDWPIAIHTGDPRAFFEPPTPDNERYAELSLAPSWSFYGDEFPSRVELLAARDRVLARHRDTTFILVHLGNNPEDLDYVDALLRDNPNAYVDTAARVGEFGRHPAAKARAFFERHADRVLFGTDMMATTSLRRGTPELSLTLGSISRPPATTDDIVPFYAQHFAYFEQSGAPIDHPVPIQGDWKVNPIGLSRDVLDKIYFGNAKRIIVAPWLGRRAAQRVLEWVTQ